jgi:hypothetical protein
VDGLKENLRVRVVDMSHERHAHPRLNGFVLPAHMTRGSAGAVTEEKGGPDRQTEGDN